MNISGYLEKGQGKAEEFIREGLDAWQEEGRIDGERADAVAESLNAPQVAAALLHVGAHFATMPLRFPIGSIVRAVYTLALRLMAEGRALLRRGDPSEARQMHTWVVMVVSLAPGFGRLAYFLSPALHSEKALFAISLDQVSRKLPFDAYSRLNLDHLFVYWALGDEEPGDDAAGKNRDVKAGRRLERLRPMLLPAAALLTLDAGLLAGGAYLHGDAGGMRDHWWFAPMGLVASVDALKLLLAGALGVMAFRAFSWPQSRVPSRHAAGIFLWLAGGLGIAVFAVDHYFGVHVWIGERAIGALEFMPLLGGFPVNLVVLSYALFGGALLWVFGWELKAARASSTLLFVAAAASLVAILANAFFGLHGSWLLERVTFTLAASLLLLAFAARWWEVRQEASQSAASHERGGPAYA